METSLHQQLKCRYASDLERTEVSLDGYRIDAIADSGELVEIQHASLGALRHKVSKLLDCTQHHLRIVKPIVGRKRLVTLTRKGGPVKRVRMSPKQGQMLDLFEDLVHFSTVFPRDRLTLEMILVEIDEVRVDRNASGWRKKKYKCLDQKLVALLDTVELRNNADLLAQLPVNSLPEHFDTSELAAALDRPRWFAQKVAYCLRKTGAATTTGKRGKSQLYRVPRRRPRAA
jgi:hypothetical protein